MAGAFTWGSGGSKLTPQDIAMQRAILARRRSQGVDTSPVGHWTQGLARVADALGDVFQEKRLDNAAGVAEEKDNALLAALGFGSATPATSSPVASALSSSTPATVPQTADAAALRQGLIDRGLPSHIADGFLVNFKDESGLNPGINEASPLVPGSRGGYGLYQLTGPRRVAYEQFAQSRGVDPSDTNSQLDFLGGELGLPNLGLENQPWFGSERSAANSILAAGDTASAAQAIVNNFLRPSQEHRDRRAASYANLGQGQVAQSAEPNVAATQSVAPANGLGVSPAVIQALSSPYASERTKTVANLLLQQQQGQQKIAQAEQQRQKEIARRQALAQQAGINPAYAVDDELWKGAASQLFQDAPTATVNGIVVNTRTGQPVFSAPQQPTSGMQDYQSYADFETQAGRTPLGPLEYEQALRRSGATSVNVGGGENRQVFDAVAASAETARSAVTGLNSLAEARRAVEGGIISGAGADTRLGLQRVGALLGVSDPQVIQNTETFRSAIAPQVAAMMKATVGSTQISNADREFAQQAAGGSISLNEGTIKRLLDIMERAGRVAVQSHMDRLNAVYPDGGGFDRERALFGVTMPQVQAATDKPVSELTDEELEALANGN